jgi:hypothetical protein
MIGINPAKSRIMEAIENKSKTINMRETLLKNNTKHGEMHN